MGRATGDAVVWRDEAAAAMARDRYRDQLSSWPVPLDQHELDTEQGRTVAWTCGDEEDPPVVLLHGAGSNSSVWRDAAVDLAVDHWVIMVDLLGEPGFSEAVRPDLRSSASADWLGQVLDQLGVRSAGFAGISFGGWTATDFATRHPERVDRLVLLCPAGIGRQATWSLLGALLVQRFGAAGRRRSAEMLTGLRHADHPEVLAEIMLVFESFHPRTDPYPVFSDASLARLTMPVLAILGERDRVFDPVDTRRRLAALLPEVSTHLEPGAGHALLGQAERTVGFLRGRPG